SAAGAFAKCRASTWLAALPVLISRPDSPEHAVAPIGLALARPSRHSEGCGRLAKPFPSQDRRLGPNDPPQRDRPDERDSEQHTSKSDVHARSIAAASSAIPISQRHAAIRISTWQWSGAQLQTAKCSGVRRRMYSTTAGS